MIGRGTRRCQGLSCVDEIDGEYDDKRRFLIFDYCGNFDFFRENINGFEVKETRALTETIFCKKVRLISALQDGAFSDAEHLDYRAKLVDDCRKTIEALSYDFVSVRLKKEYVEKFRKDDAFVSLSEMDKSDLSKHIAPLISSDDADEYAKRFDNFMYGLALAATEGSRSTRGLLGRLYATASKLAAKATIPQVSEKIELIKDVQRDDFWENVDVLTIEKIRVELRDLLQFLADDDDRPPIFTKLSDRIIETKEGDALEVAYDFEDYRKKVNRYIEEHKNDAIFYKLKHNIRLTKHDYKELERIFTQELGDANDYKREYRETPFGLLVRKIAKLDRESAMKAFSQFIDDTSMNERQIQFVYKIIDYIKNNGYVEDIQALMKPPFDKPCGFRAMFDQETRKALIETIKSITQNAIQGV